MWEKLRARLSPPMVVALLALFVALAGTTWAGTGGNFILGKSNTADKTTSLSSGAGTAALKAANTGTGTGLQATSKSSNGITGETQGPNVAGVYALNDGTGVGDGLRAISINGNGVSAQGGTAGGSFTGIGNGDGVQGSAKATGKSGLYAHHDGTSFGYGVFAKAANGYGVSGSGTSAGGTFNGLSGGDGAQGLATASGKSGLWGHHEGANNGYGVFAQSDAGPALGLLGNNNAPPITLNGHPFPSATAGWKDDFVGLPSDNVFHPITALHNLSPGTYLVITTLNVEMDRNNRVDCQLVAGADTDEKLALGDVAWSPMTLMVLHTFTGTGTALLQCRTPDDLSSVTFIKMAAVQISGGTNTAFP